MSKTINDNLYIVDNVSVKLEMPQLLRRLRVKEGSRFVPEVARLREEALAVAKPKALYKVALVEEKGEDWVVIDGVKLTSRVLRVNLEHAHRVFAYVATCGMELEHWKRSLDDILFQYWADTIKEMALRDASRALHKEINDCYKPGKTATMAPGSLSNWPLTQQRPLFTLLGDVQGLIGVELSDSFLMTPNKSISGIRFPTGEDFASCQLCPRDGCPGRRAPYDKTLYKRKYAGEQVKR